MQAANVLNEMYCRVLRKHLANYDKKKQQAKKSGTLVGDGLPRLLLSDVFYELVCDHEERQRVAEQEKEARSEALEMAGAKGRGEIQGGKVHIKEACEGPTSRSYTQASCHGGG
ncbi:hypothetical protein EV421DRAFT_1852996 [Armillaria borealis]|uniref:Uncharacterized protein n=1 Tax=Armillaria borealis TaxID=47425 RepID=A0AA39MF74_9AGAR|nr:hypothetical protein EV421DRAFT_1852996 [Armillaria borealis]